MGDDGGRPDRINPAPLPSGTLTFALTDIEGSTGLLQDLGDDFVSVLDDQERLLKSAFGARGGRLVNACGDECLFVFIGATDALAAAIDAQLVLNAHAWPRGAQVRVRMGLHTGEAKPTEGRGYVCLPVHKVHRITRWVHGGQVTLSDTTHRLVADDLPADAKLVDLGERPLKGFEDEHVFQLHHLGLSPEGRRFQTPRIAHRDRPPRSRGTAGPGRNMREAARRLQAIRPPRIDWLRRAGKAGASSTLGAVRRSAWKFP